MKVLYGKNLVEELRKLSNNIENRLWIAVPYIGNPKSVRQILGKAWFDKPSVSVKLITDTSDLTCIDTETIQHFHERGEIKSLNGLHAKIYIIDNNCLITSANLTKTAFSKRHEIGVLLSSTESKDAIDVFNNYWEMAEDIEIDKLNKIFSSKWGSKEETSVSLPTLFNLPDDPGTFIRNLSKGFLNYDRLVADYKDFTKKYLSVQRIWKDKPISF